MPIPDPDKIWPKLEKDGVDEVKKKIAMGVYANYKIPIIEEWLRRKEHQSTEPDTSEKATEQTRVDNYLTRLKNNRILAILIVIAIIIIAVANFTDSVKNLFSPFSKEDIPKLKPPMMSRMGQHNERRLTADGILVISQFEYKNVGESEAQKIQFKAILKQGQKNASKILGDDMIVSAYPEERFKFQINKFYIPLNKARIKELMDMLKAGEKIDISKEVTLSSPIYLDISLTYLDNNQKSFTHHSNYKYDIKLNEWIMEKE